MGKYTSGGKTHLQARVSTGSTAGFRRITMNAYNEKGVARGMRLLKRIAPKSAPDTWTPGQKARRRRGSAAPPRYQSLRLSSRNLQNLRSRMSGQDASITGATSGRLGGHAGFGR